MAECLHCNTESPSSRVNPLPQGSSQSLKLVQYLWLPQAFTGFGACAVPVGAGSPAKGPSQTTDQSKVVPHVQQPSQRHPTPALHRHPPAPPGLPPADRPPRPRHRPGHPAPIARRPARPCPQRPAQQRRTGRRSAAGPNWRTPGSPATQPGPPRVQPHRHRAAHQPRSRPAAGGSHRGHADRRPLPAQPGIRPGHRQARRP
ncbi:hypothetical protein D3C79_710700 [compost metagenome]